MMVSAAEQHQVWDAEMIQTSANLNKGNIGSKKKNWEKTGKNVVTTL